MTGRAECKAARGLAIDTALGQAGDGERAALEAHVAACEACRREAAALRRTVALLRRPALLEPSAGFETRLEARLDQVDARAHRRGGVRLGEELRFRLVVLGHQLRHSRAWQLRVAAALLPLIAGIALVVRERWLARAPLDVAAGDPAGHGVASDGTRPDGDGATIPPDAPRDLVAWTPKFDEPVEPPPRVTAPPDELDPVQQERATAELVRLNEIDEEALRRLRAIEREPPESAPVATARTPLRCALDWLARNQRPDGSWSAGDGAPGFETGATALALLALVSDGHLGRGGAVAARSPGDARSDAELDDVARRAAHWLLSQRAADGRFLGGHDDAEQRASHALATLALVERHLRLRARAPASPEAGAAVHEQLEQSLSWLEIALERTFAAPHERGAGATAAWGSLALATARHGGLDFHLRPSSDALCERMLAQLRVEPSDVLAAASRSVLAMAERDALVPARDREWADAVGRVLANLREAEPALRFLVASGLAGGTSPAARDVWPEFDRALGLELRAQQSASGYFDSGRAWSGWGAGTVYETALGALVLQVEARQRSARAVKDALRQRGAPR